jgi:hypothetical protein
LTPSFHQSVDLACRGCIGVFAEVVQSLRAGRGFGSTQTPKGHVVSLSAWSWRRRLERLRLTVHPHPVGSGLAEAPNLLHLAAAPGHQVEGAWTELLRRDRGLRDAQVSAEGPSNTMWPRSASSLGPPHRACCRPTAVSWPFLDGVVAPGPRRASAVCSALGLGSTMRSGWTRFGLPQGLSLALETGLPCGAGRPACRIGRSPYARCSALAGSSECGRGVGCGVRFVLRGREEWCRRCRPMRAGRAGSCWGRL